MSRTTLLAAIVLSFSFPLSASATPSHGDIGESLTSEKFRSEEFPGNKYGETERNVPLSFGGSKPDLHTFALKGPGEGGIAFPEGELLPENCGGELTPQGTEVPEPMTALLFAPAAAIVLRRRGRKASQ